MAVICSPTLQPPLRLHILSNFTRPESRQKMLWRVAVSREEIFQPTALLALLFFCRLSCSQPFDWTQSISGIYCPPISDKSAAHDLHLIPAFRAIVYKHSSAIPPTSESDQSSKSQCNSMSTYGVLTDTFDEMHILFYTELFNVGGKK